MNKNFSGLMNDLDRLRPSESRPDGKVYFFKEHPVRFVQGELEGIHWMDIQLEMPRFKIDNLNAAQKVLQANQEMGQATPIPSWFASSPQGQLVFVNRLDWQHLSADVLDAHVMRCIDQMGAALMTEGV